MKPIARDELAKAVRGILDKRSRIGNWRERRIGPKDAIPGRTLLKVKNISASILGCNSKAGIEIIYGLANYV